MFYIDYDFFIRVVAIDAADTSAIPMVASLYSDKKTPTYLNLQTTKSASTYQNTFFELLEGGLGASLNFHYKNATGAAAKMWSLLGILPMKGTEVTSVRYSDNLKSAKSISGYKTVPSEVEQVQKMKTGESVAYKSKGGVIFLGTLGMGLASLNTTSLAQGIWETYIEKVDERSAYVKITSSKLDALSMGAAVGLAQIGVQNFKNTDDGFSYLVDLNDNEAAKVYADLVRGNVAAAQVMAEKMKNEHTSMFTKLTVQKVESFKRMSKGRTTSFFFGLPIILNAQTTKSRIQSHSTTDVHVDNSKIEATFGIYDETFATKAFKTHTNQTQGFYSIRYKATDMTSKKVTDAGEMGQFTWLVQDEKTSTGDFSSSLQDIVNTTGLDVIGMKMPKDSMDLGFTSIVVNIGLSDENMKNIVSKSKSILSKDISQWVTERVKFVHAKKGDRACKSAVPENKISGVSESCVDILNRETLAATLKMQSAFKKMMQNYSNDVAYTKAFAELGQYALTNQVTLGILLSMAGEGADVVFSAEGTLLKTYILSFKTTAKDGELLMVDTKESTMAQALQPQNKKSRYHGVFSTRSLPSLGSP